MKRSFVFVLFCAVICGFTDPDKRTTDLDRQRLKGKVRSVTETRIIIEQTGDVEASGQVTFRKKTVYNIDGFETHATFYKDGIEYSFIEYEFDTAGNPVGFREYTEDGTLWSVVTYKLDEKGYRKEALYDWPEKRGYDELREKSDQLYEVLDRNPWDKVLYVIDYRGFPLEEKYVLGFDNLLFKFAYKYDILGNKVFMTYYNFKGRTTWETKYKYNREGILVESKVYKSNRIAAESGYTYQFDSNDNWTSRTEQRKVHVNILTTSLKAGSYLVQREIEYYP